MIRIPVAEPQFGRREVALVTECVKSGWISSLGPFVGRFEQALATFCGTKHAIAVSNGTVAIHLALAARGIGPGDEVIVPDLTFVATASAVTYTGARVVLADVDPGTWNIETNAVEALITERTKAIVPVHLYGHPCDMDAICRIAKRHRLFVIEDAAEALGAEYHGRAAGSLGDVGAFSFYANKTLTTGEGGVCVTNNTKLADRMRFLRDHAMSRTRRYYHPEIGFNYRLTALQAAYGVAQAERLDSMVRQKRRLAGWYRRELAGIPGVTLPPERPGIANSYWMYSIIVGRPFGASRDALAAGLRQRGIDTRPFFYPLHQLPPFKTNRTFPHAARLSRQGLNLPSSTKVTEDQVRLIAGAIREIGEKARK